MTLGPGKYDDLCTDIRERAKASAVVLIVFGGEKGTGFSAQFDLAALGLEPAIPAILRDVANRIEADQAKMEREAPAILRVKGP